MSRYFLFSLTFSLSLFGEQTALKAPPKISFCLDDGLETFKKASSEKQREILKGFKAYIDTVSDLTRSINPDIQKLENILKDIGYAYCDHDLQKQDSQGAEVPVSAEKTDYANALPDDLWGRIFQHVLMDDPEAIDTIGRIPQFQSALELTLSTSFLGTYLLCATRVIADYAPSLRGYSSMDSFHIDYAWADHRLPSELIKFLAKRAPQTPYIQDFFKWLDRQHHSFFVGFDIPTNDFASSFKKITPCVIDDTYYIALVECWKEHKAFGPFIAATTPSEGFAINITPHTKAIHIPYTHISQLSYAHIKHIFTEKEEDALSEGERAFLSQNPAIRQLRENPLLNCFMEPLNGLFQTIEDRFARFDSAMSLSLMRNFFAEENTVSFEEFWSTHATGIPRMRLESIALLLEATGASSIAIQTERMIVSFNPVSSPDYLRNLFLYDETPASFEEFWSTHAGGIPFTRLEHISYLIHKTETFIQEKFSDYPEETHALTMILKGFQERLRVEKSLSAMQFSELETHRHKVYTHCKKLSKLLETPLAAHQESLELENFLSKFFIHRSDFESYYNENSYAQDYLYLPALLITDNFFRAQLVPITRLLCELCNISLPEPIAV